MTSTPPAGPTGPESAPETAIPEAERAPVRVLLVDDEPGLRTAVKAFLEDEGFEVSTANDGEDGWTQAQQLMPAVTATGC
jgi:PleD family two-component response regulator